jgi:hypothetical protein
VGKSTKLRLIALALSTVCTAPAMAATTLLTITGKVTPYMKSATQFTAMIEFDSDNALQEAWSEGSGVYSAHDTNNWGIVPVAGTYTLQYGSVSAVGELTTLGVLRNAAMGGTPEAPLYQSSFAIGDDYTRFTIKSALQSSPLVWNNAPAATTVTWMGSIFPATNGLLPTADAPQLWQGGFNTVTFEAPGASFQVDSYAFTSVVPVPAAAWLFGSGLIGLAGAARSRKKGRAAYVPERRLR